MIAIDTNILVYAFDTSEPEKRKACKKIFEDIMSGRLKGVVTNQILAEFCYVVTSKVNKPLSRDQAADIVAAILTSENWIVLDYAASTVLAALHSKKPFWDSLIIQTLLEHDVQKIYTENTADFRGSMIAPMRPF